MNHNTVIITPTGDRPRCLRLLARWINNQKFLGCIYWLIVDDGECDTIYKFNDLTMTKVVHYRIANNPLHSPRQSLCSNIIHALNHNIVKNSENIIIMEDDDWYSQDYVDLMVQCLSQHNIVGFSKTLYYHVPKASYRIFRNRGSSLCCTAFKSHMIPEIRSIAIQCSQDSSSNLDMAIWSSKISKDKQLIIIMKDEDILDKPFMIGLKGMPGRKGIGIGHKANRFISDPEYTKLQHMVGKKSRNYIWMEATIL